MWRLLIYSILQCILLSGGQVFLKLALNKMLPFGWNREFWETLLLNWQFAMSGICYGIGSILWMYILKHFPFSMAYPMISLSYVIGMFSAIVFFHEDVSISKWIGVVMIVAGCIFIAK